MLLRITQVSGGTTDSHPLTSPTILHACLATANESANSTTGTQTQGGTQATNGTSITPEQEDAGEIFTVGRKNSTLVIDDKCVSRRHASIRLLSDKFHDQNAAASQALTQGTLGAAVEFGRPESDEEIEACETARNGVICVVKDCGSKFGTFVSSDEKLSSLFLSTKAKTDECDGDDTGDETDDEAAGLKVNYVDLTEKQVKAVQILNEGETVNTKQLPKFQKLEMNSSAILFPLSHTVDPKQSMEGSHVTILFGPQGSGIRLTLIPLQFTFSRLASKDQDRLVSCLHTIGASHCNTWDVHSTHLVTKEAKATAKHIMAWASCKPTVTQDYVLALMTRKQCTDPMPLESDYVPPGSSQLTVPLEKPCKSLKGYRIGVLLEDDSAPLAESAGADVLLIYKEAPDNEKEFTSWWRGQCQKAQEEKLALAVMETSSKKATALMKRLTGLDCRFTNQKNLAKTITAKQEDGMLLMDSDQVAIEKLSGWDEVKEDVVVEFDNDAVEEEGKKPAQEEDDVTAAGEQVEEMPVSTRRGKRKETEEEEEPEPKRRKEDTDEKVVKYFKDKDKKAETDKIAPSRTKRSRENEPAISKENSSPPAKKSAKSKATKSDASKVAKLDKPTEKVIVDEESCDESLPDEDKRLTLTVTDDGWYVAAPAVRKNYRKKIEIDDIEDEDEKNTKHAAKTAKVKGLIVREYVPPAPKTANARRANGKKDFKRFRKNHVIRGFTSFNTDGNVARKIRLVSVLPKESERQKELEMKQQELDREQAYADALFNDYGAVGKKGRRSGGSIAGYLTQPKRGRAKR